MLIKVKVFPASKKEDISRKAEDSYDIRIKEKPKRGLANAAVAELLSRYFKISPKKIRLVKGSRERNKIFDIIIK